MTIVFYGLLADAVGGELEMDFPSGLSVHELREKLAADHPTIADQLRSHRVRACVGDTIVSDSHVLARDDQIEFFPPVSGG